ncbi:NADPH-dependent FMN reductase [Algimonas porphyrae]|uniref:FMN reductase n=1 Tax=Algimonas porphyrae TaxID=1128113 RepID=A0ABQ5V218_9PROT|nr:NADPH-dependent FMN reductase [Algimonas porphyrae]GLQ20705.1 FMN reductase [Algimonas porphyrae]
MSDPVSIAFVCASLREGSINQTLETALMIKAAALDAEPVKIDLSEYDMPLYHGDLRTPDTVQALIDRLKTFDAIVIVTPEYNGSLPPLLKNVIDWTSTVETGHLTGPIYGIASCTPGPMSGIMCLRQLHYILNRVGAEVVPAQVGCGNASKAFDGEGRIAVEPTNGLADKMLGQLIERARQARDS